MSSRRANDYEPEIVNDNSIEPSVDELAPRFGMGDISGISSKAKIHQGGMNYGIEESDSDDDEEAGDQYRRRQQIINQRNNRFAEDNVKTPGAIEM